MLSSRIKVSKIKSHSCNCATTYFCSPEISTTLRYGEHADLYHLIRIKYKLSLVLYFIYHPLQSFSSRWRPSCWSPRPSRRRRSCLRRRRRRRDMNPRSLRRTAIANGAAAAGSWLEDDVEQTEKFKVLKQARKFGKTQNLPQMRCEIEQGVFSLMTRNDIEMCLACCSPQGVETDETKREKEKERER